MRLPLYNIAGYRFDDWSLVKELYTPADAGSSTKTLKDKSRSALLDHLQYYFVPEGKLFIAFRALNVELTTIGSIGIFGTSGRYGRYPESHQQSGEDLGAPFAWSALYTCPPDYHQYWFGGDWGTLVLHGDIVYQCKQTHDSAGDKEPGVGDGVNYWIEGSEWVLEWEDAKDYFKNEIVLITNGGVEGSYMCSAAHLSNALTNKPCVDNWESYWNAGDEFIKNVSISRQNMNISKGIELPFGVEILGVFSGNTAGGRWIGAKASTGTLKAGATIFGIEVMED